MKTENPMMWLGIMIGALVLLSGWAIYVQKPETLSALPIFAPTPTPTPIASANITVFAPRANELVNDQFEIDGKARSASSNAVSLRLKDKVTGQIYAEMQTYTTAAQPGDYGDFDAVISLGDLPDVELRSGTDLLIEIFQVSPKDGKEVDKVTIPVKFSPLGG